MKNDYLNTLEEGDMLIRDEFELEVDKQRVLFPVESWFDVDKKFGINTQGYDGAWVNLYSTYNPCTNEVKIYFTVDAEDGMFEREYIPTDTEKEVFVKLMEKACEEYAVMTCREFYIRSYIEQADEISLVCELCQDGCRIRNTADDFVLYAEDKDACMSNLIKYIDKEIVLSRYNGVETYSIECADTNSVIYSTDAEELQYTGEQEKEITME